MASICQIGLVEVQGGRLVREWSTLVDPQDYFAPINVSIHGIDEETAVGSPTFGELTSVLAEWMYDRVAISHSSFDRVAIQQASDRAGVTAPKCRWLDTARVARRTWPEVARSGYGLRSVCDLIGYQFKHHDALADARAASVVMVEAINRTEIDLEGWFDRVRRPISGSVGSGRDGIAQAGDPEGALYGELIVFTGALEVPRSEAAALAARAGCQVGNSVTKKTTILVVGDQDASRFATGESKSSKHRKAEKLALGGAPIRILRETDFQRMISLHQL